MIRRFVNVTAAMSLVLALLLGSCGTSGEQNNKVIAHRGAWKTEGLPQNSIASLQHAIALGCYGSEFDVHLTSDDVMVVNHDAGFMGMDIESSTYEQLRAATLPNGEHIPTVEEYLEEGLKQDRTKLILEIKTAPSGTERTLKLTRMAVALVQRLNARDMVEYICFNYEAGKLVHELDPEAEVAYLNGDVPPAEARAAGYTGLDYNIKVYRKNPEWIAEAKKEGMTLNVWTVNKEEDMKEMLDHGMDVITTDEPERLFEVLKSRGE
ncbi:glycerophosphodiester phosphodiesterase [Sinomicrobium soli]|uniref:glycerophosphodiester phosphodiesterase n=1 Tax=Sinomicrobium sp. N-1-3-6 TaxID=2219864 RepID=UPI000DCB287C|nr:glycerophosphodiester phosphodiesterase family protein [Sinomicrobium sp. N-1-3-6]RAV28921.1 glycerophosphodiester phosphodiesterase [Sinomicrobium sp. N-1-3-6]